LQGEFGIGLLSFLTVGERLTMTSGGADQRLYQMAMNKGDPRYTVNPRRVLFADPGTELKISPLLNGIRSLSGEKIQWYLASELRDRIRATQVRITVVDKLARKQYQVEPRQFEGRLLHQLPAVRSPFGEAYAETVSHGTRRERPGLPYPRWHAGDRGYRYAARFGARALDFSFLAGSDRRALPESDTQHPFRGRPR